MAELVSHTNAVNGIAWCGTSTSAPSTGNPYSNNGGGEYGERGANALLASVSDDGQVLLWDLARPNYSAPYGDPSSGSSSTSSSSRSKNPHALPKTIGLPNGAYSAASEINAVAWGGGRDYLALGMGNTVRCVRL